MCVLVPGFFFLFCVFISQIAIFCSSFSPFCYLWQLQQRDAASCHGCSRVVVVIGQGRACSTRYRNCAECSLFDSNWRTSSVEAEAEGYGESSGGHRKKDRAQGDAYLRGEERDLSAVNILCCFSGGCVNGSGAGFYFEVPTLVGAFHSLPDCFCHDLCRRLPEAGNLPSSEGRLRKREIQFLGKRAQLFSLFCALFESLLYVSAMQEIWFRLLSLQASCEWPELLFLFYCLKTCSSKLLVRAMQYAFSASYCFSL